MNPSNTGPDPKPWQQPQPAEDNPNNTNAADGGSGDLIDAGVEGASALSSVGDAAGGALEVAGGCAEGCGGCSLAILVLLSVTVGSAMAMFR